MSKDSYVDRVGAFTFGVILALCGQLYITLSGQVILPPPIQVSAPAELALRPSDRLVLKETGWLAYVTAGIQHIKYFDYESLKHPSLGGFVGLSSGDVTRRWAMVSSKGSRLDTLKIIIHEATHLKALKETGYPASELVCAEAEARFEVDYKTKYLGLTQ